MNLNKNNIRLEDDDLETEEIKPFSHYEQTLTQKIHHFYLLSYIEEPSNYVDMIHKFHVAGPDETIVIHLNTPGGDLMTGIQLINSMQSTQARVVCSLEGEACSLGSLIFLAADEFLVHDNSLMMIHNFSGGIYGKGNEQVSQLEATIKWFNNIAKKYYLPFITEDELNDVLKGEDLWLQAEDIRKRLNKMIKEKQKELKKQK